MARSTVQQALIEQALHELNNHPTAEEVFLYISKDHPSIGKATVYRTLNKLVENGKAIKVSNPVGADHFDATLEPHYHIQCRECGNVEDIFVTIPSKMLQKACETSTYQVDSAMVHFWGLCPKCSKVAENL